jgi:sugar lactone lactonase YvrE
MPRELTAIANYHCQVGENPLWNPLDSRIYWEDIESGRLFRARHDTLEHECFYQGEVVGGFTVQADGELLLFETDRIALLSVDGSRHVVRDGIDAAMRRFNDVIADPDGRVFAGTIGKTDESGGLYRIDLDGSIEVMWKGTGCANGMAFSADLSRFYWTCSTTAQIYVAEYERSSGRLSERRVLYRATPDEGTPDGLTIDSDDHLWSARWGGSRVLRIDPQGKVVEQVDFPVPKVSSAAFGGPKLDALYVTTAGGTPGSTSDEGTLYRLDVGAHGRPEFFSRIGL